jgi:hypothetical protein
MSRRSVAILLWAACVIVIWLVIYDRSVLVAGLTFTREQVLRHQQGLPVTSIHDGFSPLVREAAWRATLWVSPLAVAALGAIYYTSRRTR